MAWQCEQVHEQVAEGREARHARRSSRFIDLAQCVVRAAGSSELKAKGGPRTSTAPRSCAQAEAPEERQERDARAPAVAARRAPTPDPPVERQREPVAAPAPRAAPDAASEPIAELRSARSLGSTPAPTLLEPRRPEPSRAAPRRHSSLRASRPASPRSARGRCRSSAAPRTRCRSPMRTSDVVIGPSIAARARSSTSTSARPSSTSTLDAARDGGASKRDPHAPVVSALHARRAHAREQLAHDRLRARSPKSRHALEKWLPGRDRAAARSSTRRGRMPARARAVDALDGDGARRLRGTARCAAIPREDVSRRRCREPRCAKRACQGRAWREHAIRCRSGTPSRLRRGTRCLAATAAHGRRSSIATPLMPEPTQPIRWRARARARGARAVRATSRCPRRADGRARAEQQAPGRSRPARTSARSRTTSTATCCRSSSTRRSEIIPQVSRGRAPLEG